MTQPNNCPECNCDRYKCTDYDKLLRENKTISDRLREAYASHGVAKAEAWLRQIKLENSTNYLQRKVRKQAEAITKLEAKLKRLGQQPYKEDDAPLEWNVYTSTQGG